MNTLQEKIYTYFDRDPKLRVLFVFDNGFKQDELHSLEWAEGYKYVEFAEDWFTTKYNLDNDWKDKKVILVLQQGASGDSRSPIPMISVHSVGYLLYRRQS